MAPKKYVKHFFKKRSIYIVCTPLSTWMRGVGGGVYVSYQILGPDSISVFRGRLMEKGVTFSAGRRGCSFYIRKLRSEGSSIFREEGSQKKKYIYIYIGE